jgi:molecular chaperone GrpE
VSNDKKRPSSPDEHVLYLDELSGGDDLARALADAEKAVSAVEERHRAQEPPRTPSGTAFRSPVDTDEEPEMGIVLDERYAEAQAPAPDTESRLKELEELLARETEKAVAAEEEAGRLREAAIRKAADFENLKRRTERDKAEYLKYALSEYFRDLLPVIDNFERAMQHANASSETSFSDFKLGVQMISRQLAETLKRMGLVEVAAEGQPFNPNFHEAVAREETEAVPPGMVVAVLQKGYLLNERLLRPAMVRVSGLPARPVNTPDAGGAASTEE